MLYILLLSLSGCKGSTKDVTTEQITETTTEVTTETTTEVTTEEATTEMDPANLDAGVMDEMIQNALDHMSLEEKIGQMFIANIELLDPAEPKSYDYQKITKRMKETLKNYPVGGVIFFSRNIKTDKNFY